MSTDAPALERVTDDAPAQSLSTPAPAPAPVAAPAADPMTGIRAALERQFNPPPVPEQTASAAPAPAVEQPEPQATPAPAPAVAPGTEPAPGPPDEDVPPPVGEEVAPAPESRLAPLFEVVALPDEEALPRGIEILNDIAQYDPLVHRVLKNAAYEQNRQDYTAWALADYGIPEGRVTEFLDWAKSGYPALPAPAAVETFPEPDADGDVTLPSGAIVNIQDALGREAYENARFRFEAERSRRVQEAEAAEQGRREAEEQRFRAAQEAREQVQTRAQSFLGARQDFAMSVLNGQQIELAGDDAWMRPMLEAHILRLIDEDAELEKLGHQVAPYIKSGGARIEDFAREADRRIKPIVLRAVDQFNRRLLRANKAEIAATASQPQYPPGTRTVEVQTPVAPSTEPPRTRDEAFERGRTRVEAALTRLPVTGR